MNRSKLFAATALAGVWVASTALAEDVWMKRAAMIRAEPGPAGDPVENVFKGVQVQVVKRDGTWVQVNHNGKTGWVAAASLSSRKVDPDKGSGASASAAEMSSAAAVRGLEPEAIAFAKEKSLNTAAPDQMRDVKKSVTSQMLKDFVAEGHLGAPPRSTTSPAIK